MRLKNASQDKNIGTAGLEPLAGAKNRRIFTYTDDGLFWVRLSTRLKYASQDKNIGTAGLEPLAGAKNRRIFTYSDDGLF